MNKRFIRIKQGNFIMYNVSLTVNELINNTKVSYYDSLTGEGYQRQLIPSHYRKIAKYFQLTKDPILPPAILTAVEPHQILESTTLQVKPPLRVVDGQHRIEGIRYLEKVDICTFNKIRDYEFPVIIMVIDSNQYLYEVNTFININSKGKKVSTDLAIQLRDKIRHNNTNYSDVDKKDLVESIATKISNILSNKNNSVWFNAIKLGDDKGKGKPISINAFNESIKEIVNYYITVNPIDTYQDEKYLATEISNIINLAWDKVVTKWEKCFVCINNQSYTYSSKYNIQKGIGVYSLHNILCELIQKTGGKSNQTIHFFNDIIKQSNVTSNDWVIGGKFSPYNSKKGFDILTKHIKNEIKDITSYL